MNNSRPTQCQRIINYLADFGSITQFEAMSDLGIMRLASRISELKKKGFRFEDEFVEVKNRYGEGCFVKRYKLKEVAS